MWNEFGRRAKSCLSHDAFAGYKWRRQAGSWVYESESQRRAVD